MVEIQPFIKILLHYGINKLYISINLKQGKKCWNLSLYVET